MPGEKWRARLSSSWREPRYNRPRPQEASYLGQLPPFPTPTRCPEVFLTALMVKFLSTSLWHLL